MAEKFPRIKVKPIEGNCERCGKHSKILIKNPYGHDEKVIGKLTCSTCMISVMRKTMELSRKILGSELHHPLLTQMENLIDDLEELEHKNL